MEAKVSEGVVDMGSGDFVEGSAEIRLDQHCNFAVGAC